MTIRAILVNLVTEQTVRGHLTTETAASSYGLAVFLPDTDAPGVGVGLDPFGNPHGAVYNRGDLGPNWRLLISPKDEALAREQPAWRGIVTKLTPFHEPWETPSEEAES